MSELLYLFYFQLQYKFLTLFLYNKIWIKLNLKPRLICYVQTGKLIKSITLWVYRKNGIIKSPYAQ